MVSRRGLLGRLAVVASGAGFAGCSRILARSAGEPGVEGLPANPRANDLPDRQYAQKAFVREDDDGNDIQPRYRRILLLDLDVEPSLEAEQITERAMRTIEAAYEWSVDGVFHVLGWGTGYFDGIGRLDSVPISEPEVLSRTDDPNLLSFDAALVLASDVPSRLSAVENAMFGSRGELNGEPVEADSRLGEVFTVRQRRTGFLGEGLPADHADAEGVPDDALAAEDPAFMGFFSDRQGTQASEENVAIEDGRFAGGTTMHLSHLRLRLDRWYDAFDEDGRVARTFSPEFSADDVPDFGRDVPFTDSVREHAEEFGVVGHHEKVAQTRRDGEPVVLRRDFNTVDGGEAGVHFLSFQQSLADFRSTRKAMNGWYVRDDHQAITDRKNNGILNFITVTSRANFYVPPRDRRSFPER